MPQAAGAAELRKAREKVCEEACEEVFWLASVHPLLEQGDLDDVADAVIKVATAFAEKTRAGIPIDYGTPEMRARL